MIEVRISEDNGTARDKITIVQRLALLSADSEAARKELFQSIACVDGRGFSRGADIADMILATEGKVSTLRHLRQLVEHTRLSDFATR